MTRVHRLPSLAGVRSVARSIKDHPANAGRVAPVIARTVLAQAKWRLSGRPTVVPFGDRSRIEAHLDAGSSKRALYASLPDFAEMRVWQRMLRPGDVFVDVGANAGLYTVLACELGAEVIAVEPLADGIAQLRRNLTINGYEAMIVEAVVGAAPGTAHIGGPDSQRAHVGTSGTEVAMVTLDDLVGDRAVRGVKIDVEGAERQVLEGASRLLGDHRVSVVQLEWNDRAMANYGESREPLARLLEANGYRLYRPDHDGSLLPTDGREGSDVFAVRGNPAELSRGTASRDA